MSYSVFLVVCLLAIVAGAVIAYVEYKRWRGDL